MVHDSPFASQSHDRGSAVATVPLRRTLLFPRRIRGEAILIEARILAVAVALEDWTTHRSYRNAFPIDEALDKISSGSGSKYDPDVAAASLKLFKER